MANRENASVLKFVPALNPKAATTDNTAYVSDIVDMAGYDSATFVWHAGSIADVDATFTLLVEHGDVSNLSDAAAVSDAELTALETAVAPTFGSDNSTGKIGYIGGKRYARVTITPAANSGNIFLSGMWVLGGPSQAPVA